MNIIPGKPYPQRCSCPRFTDRQERRWVTIDLFKHRKGFHFFAGHGLYG